MTLYTGQLVQWQPAPDGVAQVEDLLRRNVRLCYRCKSGRLRMPIVPAEQLQPATGWLFDNVYDRASGMKKRSKSYPPPNSRRSAVGGGQSILEHWRVTP